MAPANVRAAKAQLDAAIDAALAGARLDDLDKRQLAELREAVDLGALELVTAHVKPRLLEEIDRRLGARPRKRRR